jgi:hypothetical protein
MRDQRPAAAACAPYGVFAEDGHFRCIPASLRRIAMRSLALAAVILLPGSMIMAAQSGDVVCRQQSKTSNNCYRLYRSLAAVQGLVVLLPYYGSDANEFSSAELPSLLAKRGIDTMVVSAAGYMNDDDLLTLEKLIKEVATERHIPSDRLVVGGISAGGTGAVRYYEYCVTRGCGPTATPVAIFSVDAPLDFESWWRREKLNLRRANPKSGLEESEAILEALRSAMGGSPGEVPQVYRSRSPFLASEKGGGNARLLKSVPIRLYTEPDVVWMVENVGRDYYTMNAQDQAALFLQLRAIGNTNAALIISSGKGFRPPGTRNPHSWTIVDETDLADWIGIRLHS